MHAILASLGTDGDVLPFIGLGVALRARGHRVTVVASSQYADLIASHWLEFRQLVSAEEMKVLLGNVDFWHPLKTARFTAKWGTRLIEPQYRLFSELAQDGEAVFVSNPAIFAAMLAHEKQGRPLATIILQPWMIPSASAPPIMPIIGLPAGAPPIFHRFFFRCIDFAADQLFGRTLNRIRRSLGLKPMRRLLRNWFSRDLVLGMFPDWYGPPQSDWPKQIRLTGFPLFDATLNRALPAGLQEFLANAKPTIAFTFGSGMMHGPQLFHLANQVCARLDAQGLFINRFQSPPAPPHMFHASFASFKDVFPRCAAIVHHGGIGTTAEALAAGKPQYILPLGFDQLDNGVRVKKLGAGLHAPSRHAFVSKKTISEREINEVATAVARLLDPAFQASAAKASQRMRSPNGLETAADLFEKFIGARFRGQLDGC
jgi:UDP:flavonoid glycosyltransferase YjiC (YdhE family)